MGNREYQLCFLRSTNLSGQSFTLSHVKPTQIPGEYIDIFILRHATSSCYDVMLRRQYENTRWCSHIARSTGT